MKKIITVFLAVLMLMSVVLGVVACDGGKGKPNFDIPEEGFDITKQIELTFYTTMGKSLRDVFDPYVEEFQKLYPNITIKTESQGGYDDVKSQINTELMTGDTLANFAYCYPDHVASYNLPKAVVTLDNLIDSTLTVTRQDGTTEMLGFTQEQKDDFIKGYYEEGMQFGDGLMYSLPFSKSTEVLYYNKTFFDANNISVPTHWWCTNECPEGCDKSMEKVCAKIKSIKPTDIPLGYDSEANWFITMCEQLGSDYTSATGDHFLFDNKTNRDFVKRFRGWYQQGWVVTQELYGAYTSGLFTGAGKEEKKDEDGNVIEDEYKNTLGYMCIGSSAGASHQIPADDAFEVGIAPIPQVDPANPKVISQGPSLCVFKKDDPQEVLATWLFIKYLLTNVEFLAEFSLQSGYVAPLKSVAENEAYKSFLDKANGYKFLTSLSAKVCVEQENAYYTSPAFNGSSVARSEVNALLAKCLSGKLGESQTEEDFIKKAFEEAVEECEYSL